VWLAKSKKLAALREAKKVVSSNDEIHMEKLGIEPRTFSTQHVS
jgi:hypothetical protein